jgi:hypothetical protein
MQINNYADLVAFVRNNTVFKSLGALPADAADDNDTTHELELFAARVVVDFVLANPQLRALAVAEHNETDDSILHEWLFDDVA